MPIRVPLLVLMLMLAAAGVARAEGDDPEGPEREIARGVIRNVRRSIAFGPTAGAFSSFEPSGSELDGGISFGLELELFQTTLPTPARVKELVRQKTQEKLAAIIRDRFAGQPPDAATQRDLLREIAAAVKAEVIASLHGEPRRFERPRLAIALEANYQLGAADWLPRLGLAIGVGPLSIGPTFSVRFGDGTVARLGADLAVHLLPTKSPRSPVLDLFLRSDFELHARDTNDDQLALGLRVLLDVI